jgi:hypothetical protein
VTLVSFKLAAAKEVYTRTDSLAGGPGAISWFSLPLLQQVDPTDTVIIIECHDQAGAGRPGPRDARGHTRTRAQNTKRLSRNQLLLVPPSQLAVVPVQVPVARAARADSRVSHTPSAGERGCEQPAEPGRLCRHQCGRRGPGGRNAEGGQPCADRCAARVGTGGALRRSHDTGRRSLLGQRLRLRARQQSAGESPNPLHSMRPYVKPDDVLADRDVPSVWASRHRRAEQNAARGKLQRIRVMMADAREDFLNATPRTRAIDLSLSLSGLLTNMNDEPGTPSDVSRSQHVPLHEHTHTFTMRSRALPSGRPTLPVRRYAVSTRLACRLTLASLSFFSAARAIRSPRPAADGTRHAHSTASTTVDSSSRGLPSHRLCRAWYRTCVIPVNRQSLGHADQARPSHLGVRIAHEVHNPLPELGHIVLHCTHAIERRGAFRQVTASHPCKDTGAAERPCAGWGRTFAWSRQLPTRPTWARLPFACPTASRCASHQQRAPHAAASCSARAARASVSAASSAVTSVMLSHRARW